MGYWEPYSLVPHFGFLRKKNRGNELYLSLEDRKIMHLEIVIDSLRQSVPKEIEALQNLYSLDIFIEEDCKGNLFKEKFCLPSVRNLYIFCTVPVTISDSFDYFPNLRRLEISGFSLYNRPYVSFENSFKKLAKLEELDLKLVRLEKIPNSILNLTKLNWLNLFKTTLKKLPISLLYNLKSLETLELSYNFELDLKKREIKKLEKKVKFFIYSSLDDYQKNFT
ncbi:MAG TPA: hypothetical protein ENI29_00840 [bacterium]|nr:hypothetical protein [bacterium]